MPRKFGKFSRLKPVEQDWLESIGLPSKGDTRLLDPKTQQEFYTKIVGRYMSLCSNGGKKVELIRRLEQLELRDSVPSSIALPDISRSESVASHEEHGSFSPSQIKGLSDILMALRKLREGIVASKRTDDFATQVYLFCIRLAIVLKQSDSYHPAILHLIHRIHPVHPLTSSDFSEVVSYMILDAACRRRELAEAFALRSKHKIRDPKIYTILKALVHDDYVMFRKAMNAVDGHRSKLMEFAESDVRMHTLKCFGRTYFSVELKFLEKTLIRNWEDLKKEEAIGWELEGQKIVIRRPKGR